MKNRLLSILIAIFCLSIDARAQAKPELRFAVIVSRHGVRSPTAPVADLAKYSAEPWPSWGVKPGELTPHGAKLMTLFGAWYRDYFAGHGLIAANGCGDASKIYFRADSDQRTRASAVALADGLLPGCPADPHALKEGVNDPLFDPLAAGESKPDPAVALASVLGRAGGSPEAFASTFDAPFAELDRLLGKPLPRAPLTIAAGNGDNPVNISGALRTASTLTENLLLEYANGMSGKDLGWGRLTAANLREVLALHTAYADLARRTPYLARARSGKLLGQVVSSLQQASTGRPVQGAIGPPGTRLVVISGHDTNISNIAGMLGLNWALPGYATDDAPPGGALVFELWRRGGTDFVRTWYTVQSLDQMHDAIPLTRQSPPLRARVFVPGCGSAGEGFECTWVGFQRVTGFALESGR